MIICYTFCKYAALKGGTTAFVLYIKKKKNHFHVLVGLSTVLHLYAAIEYKV